jgi:hypothetical protein
MKKLTIEAMRFMAKKRGGKCLSRVYVNWETKLLWRCGKGHEWKASQNSVSQGSWCPKCAGHGKTVFDLQGAARLRNGKCLSKSYKGIFVKHQWKCASGHIFEATPTQVLNNGSWCHKCYLATKKLNPKQRRKKLLEMKRLARSKNGQCLSTEYFDRRTHLQWRCQKGHEWSATPEAVQKSAGTWCATCAAGVSERICRALLERMLGTAFPKKKPTWLQSARKTRLELDGYSEVLGIAFEYQGKQHFVNIKHFHSGNIEFRQRLADDKQKVKLCRKHGVVLLQIPYTVPHLEFENYIRNLLKRHGKNQHAKVVLNRMENGKIDLSTLNAYSPASLLEMQQLANKHGGKCLSKVYVNSNTKLRWRCKFGHIWESPPASIKTGSWCHKCIGYRQHTLAEMKALARKLGGKCLAAEYLGYNTKILWKCAKGHSWNTTPGRVINGAWCPYCANRPPITIDDVRTFIEKRGGKCLSTQYIDAHKKLLVQCSEGHKWKPIWNNLQQGNWCRICSMKKAGEGRRLTIDSIQKIAQKKDGQCLSKKYINCETKLLWQCQHGHQWLAKSSHVKRGSWCPICIGRKARNVSQISLG